VLHRYLQDVAVTGAAGERRPRGLDANVHLAAHEGQARIADQGPRQEAGLAQDLEAVADAQDRPAALGVGPDRVHDSGEPGDGSCPQVVPVGEPAGQDHRVGAVQVVVPVPHRDGLCTHEADGPLGVAVVERPREGDHGDPGAHEAGSAERIR
jgi:hypothetical protein